MRLLWYFILLLGLQGALNFRLNQFRYLDKDYRSELVAYNRVTRGRYAGFPPSEDLASSRYVYMAPLQPDEDDTAAMNRTKRGSNPVKSPGHAKSKQEKWHITFRVSQLGSTQFESLITLLDRIVMKYFQECIPVFLYDSYVQEAEGDFLQKVFTNFSNSFMHGKISANYTVENPILLEPPDSRCRSYILFLADVMQTKRILGPQIDNKVIVVPRSTQWKLQEFLQSPDSRDIINLLIIGESYTADRKKERPYVLYTHLLYTDGIGSSKPIVLTSWIKGKFSRPHVNLFPKKLTKGFAGHSFLAIAAHQPPFIIKKTSTDPFGNLRIEWDGLEIRILKVLGEYANFTFEIREASSMELGPGDAVAHDLTRRRGDIGLGGMYVTSERIIDMEMSVSHSTDCAAFVTLMSRALPRSRAILGPFQYPVWICLTAVYLLAIFPLAFSDRLSLSHIVGNWGELENMFWYVFGTFTNSLTFGGEYSWSKSKKSSTRILIGWYWMFTIIVTACYTGSIISFVTLPITPETVDNVDQLRAGFYRIGTLDRGGWERWFLNSTHESTAKLMKNLEFVSDLEEGFNNVTQAWFFPYAFINSRRLLDYVLVTNYTMNKIGRRSALHVSDNCFALYGVAMGFPEDSVYRNRFNDAILRLQASGLDDKLMTDVIWDMTRETTKAVIAVKQSLSRKKAEQQEERMLTLADTEGMFILLGIGFIAAAAALLSEWIGGCTNKVMFVMKVRREEREEREAEVRGEEERRIHELEMQQNIPTGLISPPPSAANGGLATPSSIPPTSSGTSLASLNKSTLSELCAGPTQNRSSMIYFEGKMMPDDSVYEALRHRNVVNEIVEMKHVGKETIYEPNETPESPDGEICRKFAIEAEINHQK